MDHRLFFILALGFLSGCNFMGGHASDSAPKRVLASLERRVAPVPAIVYPIEPPKADGEKWDSDFTAKQKLITQTGELFLVGEVGAVGKRDIQILKYDSEGHREFAFGKQGSFRFRSDCDEHFVRAQLDANGRLLLLVNQTLCSAKGGASPINALLMSVLGQGVLEAKFGNRGTLVLAGEGIPAATAFQIDPFGRVLVVGNRPGQGSLLFMRFHSSGQRDLSFGVSGKNELVLPQMAMVHAIRVLPDASFVFGGEYLAEDSDRPLFFIGKALASGELDAQFGDQTERASVAGLNVLPLLEESRVLSIEIRKTGEIVAVGSHNFNGFIAQFNAQGKLDENFAVDGVWEWEDTTKTTSQFYALQIFEDDTLLLSATSVAKSGDGGTLGKWTASELKLSAQGHPVSQITALDAR